MSILRSVQSLYTQVCAYEDQIGTTQCVVSPPPVTTTWTVVRRVEHEPHSPKIFNNDGCGPFNLIYLLYSVVECISTLVSYWFMTQYPFTPFRLQASSFTLQVKTMNEIRECACFYNHPRPFSMVCEILACAPG